MYRPMSWILYTSQYAISLAPFLYRPAPLLSVRPVPVNTTTHLLTFVFRTMEDWLEGDLSSNFFTSPHPNDNYCGLDGAVTSALWTRSGLLS